MSAAIQPGDMVRVKSGGTTMTVTHIEDDAGTLTAWCVWFNGKKKCEDTFPVVSLEKVENPKPKAPAKSGWGQVNIARARPGGTV